MRKRPKSAFSNNNKNYYNSGKENTNTIVDNENYTPMYSNQKDDKRQQELNNNPMLNPKLKTHIPGAIR